MFLDIDLRNLKARERRISALAKTRTRRGMTSPERLGINNRNSCLCQQRRQNRIRQQNQLKSVQKPWSRLCTSRVIPRTIQSLQYNRYNTIVMQPDSVEKYLGICARSAAMETFVLSKGATQSSCGQTPAEQLSASNRGAHTEGVAVLWKGSTLSVEMNGKQESRRAFAC